MTLRNDASIHTYLLKHITERIIHLRIRFSFYSLLSSHDILQYQQQEKYYDVSISHTFLIFFFQRNKEVFVADFEFRERMFTSITDLITLAIFLGISPGVKEAMTAYLRGDDKKDLTPYKNFLKQTGKQYPFPEFDIKKSRQIALINNQSCIFFPPIQH